MHLQLRVFARIRQGIKMESHMHLGANSSSPTVGVLLYRKPHVFSRIRLSFGMGARMRGVRGPALDTH